MGEVNEDDMDSIIILDNGFGDTNKKSNWIIYFILTY